MAHPLRLRLLDELMGYDAATATELAQRIGDSHANCSWHLRMLARHGFIEEAPGGTGRQRPWRVVRRSQWFRRFDDESAELRTAANAAQDVLYERAMEAHRAWREARARDTKAWREGAHETLSWAFLTADELAAFSTELEALLAKHLTANDRIDPAKRPPGCRPVRVVAYVVPAGPDAETPGEAAP